MITTLRQHLGKFLDKLGSKRHRRATLTGVLAIALALRLAAAKTIPLDYRHVADAVRHTSIAQNLLTLGVYGSEPGGPYAIMPPGYPLFVADIFSLTNQSLMAVRLAQAVLSIFGPVPSLLVTLAIFTISITADNPSMTPMGLGVRDAALLTPLLCVRDEITLSAAVNQRPSRRLGR
jgi:uncharacterized membrane protein YbhN (UPF0104 family)